MGLFDWYIHRVFDWGKVVVEKVWWDITCDLFKARGCCA